MKTNNEYITFLEERIRNIEENMRQSAEYVEIQVLTKIVKDLQALEPDYKSTKRRPYIMSGKYRKNPANLKNRRHALAEVPYGGRMKFIHDKVLKLVTDNNGEMPIDQVIKGLKEQGIGKRNKRFNFTSYISNYAKLHPKECKLEILPKASPGKLRAFRLKMVKLVA